MKNYNRWVNTQRMIARAKKDQLRNLLYVIKAKQVKYNLSPEQILADLVDGMNEQIKSEIDRKRKVEVANWTSDKSPGWYSI